MDSIRIGNPFVSWAAVRARLADADYLSETPVLDEVVSNGEADAQLLRALRHYSEKHDLEWNGDKGVPLEVLAHLSVAPKKTALHGEPAGIQRVGAWGRTAALRSPEKYASQASELGLTDISLVINDAPRRKSWHTLASVDEVVNAVSVYSKHGIRVSLLSWMVPTREWVDGFFRDLSVICSRSTVFGIDLDLETPWTKAKSGHDEISAYFWQKWSEKPLAKLGVTAIVFADFEKIGYLARRADYVIPQAYSTNKYGYGSYTLKETEREQVPREDLFPGAMQQTAEQLWMRRLPDVPIVMGLAAFRQEGAGGLEAAAAMEKAIASSEAVGCGEVRYWSLPHLKGAEGEVVARWTKGLESTDDAPEPSPPSPLVLPAPSSSGGDDLVIRGSFDARVLELQQALTRLGYELVRWGADGVLGEETLEAVDEWAEDHALPQTASDDRSVEGTIVRQILNEAGDAPTTDDSLLSFPLIRDYRDEAWAGVRKRRNSISRVDTICLHQIAAASIRAQRGHVKVPASLREWGAKSGEVFVPRGSGRAKRWRKLAIHFVVTCGDDAEATWNHDLGWRLSHGHGWNGRSVGIEFEGYFAGAHDLSTGEHRYFWRPPSADRLPMVPTERQLEAGRQVCRFAVEEVERLGGKIRFIAAHRQAYGYKASDPGALIWKGVAMPIMDELGLEIGPVLPRSTRSGKPIPEVWDPKRRQGVPYR